MQESKITEAEISRVRNFMMLKHCGYRAAAPRKEIASILEIEDRHFRKICAEIPEIIASSHYGYWILPLVDTTGIEADIARQVVEGENRRRMIALYLRQRRQREAIRKMANKEAQQEMEFVGR